MGVELDGANQKIIIDADSDTYLQANTDDTLDMYIAGAKDFTFTANTLTAQSGSTIAAQALTATTIGATGVVSISDGTAGAPALTNTGDTNCGLYFSAADTLSFTAAGTAQITMADGVVAPVTDNDVDLGTSSLEFKDGYFDGTLYCDTLNLAGTAHTAISGGLEEVDQWRITTQFDSGTSSPKIFDSNWERNDTNSDKIGTGMSESSGIFTFPSTGIWKVEFVMSSYNSGDGLCHAALFYTPDNSTYTIACNGHHALTTALDYNSAYTCIIFDVDDTANDKVKFGCIDMDNASTIKGNSTYNYTYATFMKLGAT